MQTHFSLAALADPDVAQSEKILRACVHCGFCTATCPTYLLTGDELDSPRGRIYLIKEMLEHERPADARTARHVDRCLSCLSCMTTCPSGVHYARLVDHARAHIEATFVRPFSDRMLRGLLAFLLPRPQLLRVALRYASAAKPYANRLAERLPERLRALLALAPDALAAPSDVDRPQVFPATGARQLRVALLNGCAQSVIDTRINEAAVRFLTRHGVEVVVAEGAGCCGALPHHLGKVKQSHAFARRNIQAWTREIERGGLDHIVVTTSGCGTSVKDYGFMFRRDAKRGAPPRASPRSPATSANLRRSSPSRRKARSGVPKSPITPPARCSMGKRSCRSPFRRWNVRVSMSPPFRRDISAADRREPTICCSRSWPNNYAREKSPISRASRPT